jgi:hypothetical protein
MIKEILNQFLSDVNAKQAFLMILIKIMKNVKQLVELDMFKRIAQNVMIITLT